jgi:hypothetical protein
LIELTLVATRFMPKQARGAAQAAYCGSHPAASGRSGACGLGRSGTRRDWRGGGSRSAATGGCGGRTEPRGRSDRRVGGRAADEQTGLDGWLAAMS